MKRTTNKESHFCDACDGEIVHGTVCLICGSEYCHLCTEYNGHHYSTYMDGFFCYKCIFTEHHNPLLSGFIKYELIVKKAYDDVNLVVQKYRRTHKKGD